jgi:hypothetical protein
MSALPCPPPANETGHIWRIEKPPAHKVVRPYSAFLKGSSDPLLAKALPPEIPIYCLPVHSTDLRDWSRCRRYYFFAHRLGLKPIHQYRPAYKRGEWFHKTVETWIIMEEEPETNVTPLHSGPAECVRHTMDTVFNEWWAKLEKSAKEGVLSDSTVLADFMAEATADYLKAREMGIVFARDLGIHPSDHVILAVEQQIYCRVKGISRPLAGRLDLTTRDPDSRVWIDDHKSTGDPPAEVIASLALDFQNHHYRLLAAARYPSSGVMGIVHNVVQTPSIRYSPKVKDKDGPEHYGDRVTEWYAERTAESVHVPDKAPALRSKTYFGDTEWPPDDYLQVLREVAVASHTRPILSRFPRCGNSYQCRGANTSRRYACPFLLLCRESSPAGWRKHLDGRFEQQTLEEMERDNASDSSTNVNSTDLATR